MDNEEAHTYKGSIMKIGLYAGSFDPWSIGHQYVLENALDIFDEMHVVVAVHPSKRGTLDADTRARLVAHANDPNTNWWDVDVKQPLILKNKKLTVTTFDGLVAKYAQKRNITHLIRGMRSTTDFEAEFNLYFANHAIDSKLKTWAIMCPPNLLYCSSTFIRAVVGEDIKKQIGTSFSAQSLMLGASLLIGQFFDLYYLALAAETDKKSLHKVSDNLQNKFTKIVNKEKKNILLPLDNLHTQLFENADALKSPKYYEDLYQKIDVSH